LTNRHLEVKNRSLLTSSCVMSEPGFTTNFPAIRARQAGEDFYVVMCPMRLLPSLFAFDDEEVPPEVRAQRVLNKARLPEIARYLINNPNEYIISAITASVDASVQFQPMSEMAGHEAVGTLSIPMGATLLINDGQHRRAAIEMAIREEPRLKDDAVPVLLFIDRGLARSQQMFADLNQHSIRPSDSLSTLYDQRDPSSELARLVALSVEGFIGMTEMEKTSISNRSTKLFTLSGIKSANRALLKKSRNQEISSEERAFAVEYWNNIVRLIPDWMRAKRREVSTSELRQNFIHSHGVALSALGLVGYQLVKENPTGWAEQLCGISCIDWSRSNTELWEGRALVLGKINKSTNNVALTANVIKKAIGLEFSEGDETLEELLANG
jgi:DNA sulfur modification protein DndB